MTSSLVVETPGANDVFQPKLVYLARRNPALSRQEFVARWRRHGALGMSLPRWRNVARYVHCDALAPPAPNPRVDTTHDAIGIVWHRSPAARAAHLADAGSREQMERDELETFSRPIVETCLLAREHVLLAPAATGSSVKLTRFLPGADDPSTLRQATEPGTGVERRQRLAEAGAPVRGHLLDLPLPPERGSAWGLDCAVIEELWFDDLGNAARAARWFGALQAAPATVMLLTNEVLLYPT